jgi:hypothetical protein
MAVMLLIALLAALDAASAYKIETQATKARHGTAAKAHVEVVPVQGAHVSPDAPISLTVHSGAFSKVEKEKLGRADSKPTSKQGVAFDVPFTSAQAGKDELKGTLNFFICTESLCEKQVREVTLALELE